MPPVAEEPGFGTIPASVSAAWLESSDHPVAKRLREEFPELTVYERRMLIFFLTSALGNGAVAARMAGYEPRGKKDNARVVAAQTLTKVNILQARQAIAPLLFGALEGQLENMLYTQATEAVVHQPAVYVPSRTNKDGKCVEKGHWEYPELRPDIRLRVQALKDLKALSEDKLGGKQMGEQIVVMLDPRITGDAPLDAEALAYPGYYPALEPNAREKEERP